jgi:hypothetical protein
MEILTLSGVTFANINWITADVCLPSQTLHLGHDADRLAGVGFATYRGREAILSAPNRYRFRNYRSITWSLPALSS